MWLAKKIIVVLFVENLLRLAGLCFRSFLGVKLAQRWIETHPKAGTYYQQV